MRPDLEASLTTFETPDATFFHEEATCNCCPNVVVEVSSRWRPKDLAALAESYTVGSIGGISCALGFNLDTGKGRTATVSVWRTDIDVSYDIVCSRDVDAIPFRDATGCALAGALESRVDDFLGPDARDRIDDQDRKNEDRGRFQVTRPSARRGGRDIGCTEIREEEGNRYSPGRKAEADRSPHEWSGPPCAF